MRRLVISLVLTLVFPFSVVASNKSMVFIDNLDFCFVGSVLYISGEVHNYHSNYVLVTALFDERNVLIDLDYNAGQKEVLSLNINENLHNYKVKVFALENLSSIRPLCKSYEADEVLIKTWDSIRERKALIIDNFYQAPFPSPNESNNPQTPNNAINIGRIGVSLAMFYKNTELEEANRLITLACTESKPELGGYQQSETYFQMSIIARIFYQYNEVLTSEAKNTIKEYFWDFINHYSKYSEAQDEFAYADGKYYIESTGNHHVVKRTAYLLGSQMLKDDESYKNRFLEDGYTVKQHFGAWEHYWKNDFRTRGKKAYEQEYFSNGYDKYTLDCILTIRDCTQSEKLRDLSEKYMDLVLTDMVVLSNEGVFGGARGRSVRTNELDRSADSYFQAMFFNKQSSWRIKNVKDPVTKMLIPQNRWASSGISYHPNQIALAASSYKPPFILMDLVLGNKGIYEYESYPIGKGYKISPEFNRFYMEFPTLYKRYSFVTPHYVVGSMTYDRNESYSDIQQQNRYIGIHFTTTKRDPVYSRVFADTQRSYSRGFNDINSVASGSAMIVMALPEAKYYNPDIHRDIIVGVSKNFFENSVVENGWMFAFDPYGEGYIAVKPSRGQIEGWDNNTSSNIKYLLFTEKNVPVVFQAGSISEYGNFESFKLAVNASRFVWVDEDTFEYESSGYGEKITWYISKKLPKVNNETTKLYSNYIFKSPYLTSEYDSGIIEIMNTKNEVCVLDFNI